MVLKLFRHTFTLTALQFEVNPTKMFIIPFTNLAYILLLIFYTNIGHIDNALAGLLWQMFLFFNVVIRFCL